MADKKNKVQAAPLFQTVTVKKKNGRDCKFIVFNRKQFLNRYKELNQKGTLCHGKGYGKSIAESGGTH